MEIYDDGIRLSAILERPGREPGPLAIVIHGFTSAKERPHTIAACEAMRDAGCATLRMDMYGHGESGGEVRKHTLYKWLSNIMAAVDWARSQDFVTDIYLSGHSQGGLAAALAAAIERDRVKGLILRAPAFMIPRCAREGNLLGRAFDPDHIPDEIEVIKGLTLEGNYVRVAQAVRAEEAMDRFTRPVLILHGDRDDVVPLQDSLDASRRYKNCRLEIMEGETHHFDHDPEKMKAAIREWLIRVS